MDRNNHKINESLPTLIFWVIVFVSIFLFFQLKYAFHFFYIEQLQLFLYTESFARETILQPGGVTLYLSLFLVQLYIYPGVGAFITALLLTGIGLLLQVNMRRWAPPLSTYLLSILPIAPLLVMHTDIYYKTQGTISLLCMLGSFYIFTGISNVFKRLAVGIVLTLVLFLLAGPVSFLFTLVTLLTEISAYKKKSYLFLFLPVEMILIAHLSLRLGWQGEYGMILSPAFYYEYLLEEKSQLYIWTGIGSCLLISRFSQQKQEFKKGKYFAFYILQFIPIPLFLCFMVIREDRLILKSMEQDYYVRHEQWDKVIETFHHERYNTQMINLLNLALAKKGQLGDRLFEYQQHGATTLITPWDDTTPHAIALCEIFYNIGDIGTAQKLAFECCIGSQSGGNVRMLQRLVETNLIYGAYPVAEKYIALLEKTHTYKKWAQKHRHYLYNEQAFEKGDALYLKRKGLIQNNSELQSVNLLQVLEQLIESDPANPLPIQYLVSMSLVRKDLKSFRHLVDIYAKTSVWPSLAKSQQEAIIILEQKKPFFWLQYGVTAEVEQRFRSFDDMMKQSKTTFGVENKMSSVYGSSFWYYLVFSKI